MYDVRERSHITSSLRGEAAEDDEGGNRRMMTLAIFLMGNNSNIEDEGGVGGKKGHCRDDVICERSLTFEYD